MIKTFTHTFKNGYKITLTVDLTSNPPHMTANKKIDNLLEKDKDFENDYKTWTEKIVMPEIYKNLSKKQIKYFENKNNKNS